jgi:hypothetical protein
LSIFQVLIFTLIMFCVFCVRVLEGQIVIVLR